ncbi:hypothetical protein Avbf_06621 [Armadillidium vulgare]|nr:hypothetical protein Avbf_06621 [Armadillidium vulgare]
MLEVLAKLVVVVFAITRSMRNSERAWLRRMAVKKEYRRREIGSHLVREAIKFCQERKYAGIELITTEHHGAAKQLYWNEGFVNSESMHKAFLGFGGNLLSFKMYRPLNKPETIEEATESQNKTEEQKDLIHF